MGGSARIFLLSPARSDGERAKLLLRKEAGFDLARRLRSEEGVALGEVYSFLSGLYFRGKLAYARTFGRAREGDPAAWVITPTRGLVAPEAAVRLRDLRTFARASVDEEDRRYRAPLERAARALAEGLHGDDEVVLLGSIASSKYVGVLEPVLGARLRFPREFVGRGDMSRGGLMLRRVREGSELEYVAVAGAVRHGTRPPRLPRAPRRAALPEPRR